MIYEPAEVCVFEYILVVYLRLCGSHTIFQVNCLYVFVRLSTILHVAGNGDRQSQHVTCFENTYKYIQQQPFGKSLYVLTDVILYIHFIQGFLFS